MSCLFTCLRREPAEIKNNKKQLSQYGAASGACVDWFVCNNYIDDQSNSFQSHYTSRGGLEYTLPSRTWGTISLWGTAICSQCFWARGVEEQFRSTLVFIRSTRFPPVSSLCLYPLAGSSRTLSTRLRLVPRRRKIPLGYLSWQSLKQGSKCDLYLPSLSDNRFSITN